MAAQGCDRSGPVIDAGRSGTSALSLGTVTVSAPAVTAASLVFLTPQSGTTPLGLPWVSGKTAGTGFTVSSLAATDTANVGWLVAEHT